MLSQLQKMTRDQLYSLEIGIQGICDWYQGHYIGLGVKTDLLIEAQASQQSFTYLVNAMAWLSKYFAPKSVQDYEYAYRLHDSAEDHISPDEKTVTVKPFKPILSWSTKPDIYIDERTPQPHDLVLKLAHPRVLFSPTTAERLDITGLQESNNRQIVEIGVACARLKGVCAGYRDENEIVVWHGTAPFQAEILEDRRPASVGGPLDRGAQALAKYDIPVKINEFEVYDFSELTQQFEGYTAVNLYKAVHESLGDPTRVVPQASDKTLKNEVWDLGDVTFTLCMLQAPIKSKSLLNFEIKFPKVTK